MWPLCNRAGQTPRIATKHSGVGVYIRYPDLVRTLFHDFEVPTGGSGLFCLAARLVAKQIAFAKPSPFQAAPL